MCPVHPMLATKGTSVPAGEEWVHEVKWDGVRVLTEAGPERVRMWSRNANDVTVAWPELSGHPLDGRDLLVDGEIIALNPHGLPDFRVLQDRMHVQDESWIATRAAEAPAAFIAFDLLMTGDDVLVREPWSVRRGTLEKLIRNRTSPTLRLGESAPNEAERMLERARDGGWEGVIAKRADAPYVSKRSRQWLKFKCSAGQELVIGGFTAPGGSRIGFGALLLGYYDQDALRYAGRVGTGFSDEMLRLLHGKLERHARRTSPFADFDDEEGDVTWVSPRLVGEIGFTEWTRDGRLRHPRFLGLRDDKPARQA